jgi:hypothetical protein
VDRDLLERAAGEFLIEGYEYRTAEKILRDTHPDDREEAREKLLSPRTVPDGCFVFLQHIIWLEQVLEIVPGIQLSADEVSGILVLRRARNQFQRTHPPCPHCGMPNDETALCCRECMKEISR